MIFIDTCSLLKKEDIFEENFVISSVTLNELEGIKTSADKDSDIKFAARRILKALDENPDKYKVHVFKLSMLKPFIEADLDITNDIKILATAYDYKQNFDNEIEFITNDISLKNIATLFFKKENISSIINNKKEYTGYLEVNLNNDEMADFYSNMQLNIFNLLPNQYLNIYDENSKLVDTLCWTGEEHRPLNFDKFKTRWFGSIKPKDVYQRMAFDSFNNNQMTVLRGPAGSGKDYCALSYMMFLLEKGSIDKIIIFCNTVATIDSAKLGFYPGTREEKLIDASIGNILSSKLGGREALERMIIEEKIILLPMSDIRGFDTSGANAGIYITEAQNTTINLMKLCLQRIGEDSVVIINGDDKTQVDLNVYQNGNNGLNRTVEIFKGKSFFGNVTLKKIHRSAICETADLM